DWAPDVNPMTLEESGFWATDIHGAKPGHEYKYRIVNGEFDAMRIDPYAREVTNSVGNGVIVDPIFEWEADDYRTPGLNEMIIYEIHIGTFNPGEGHKGTLDSAI